MIIARCSVRILEFVTLISDEYSPEVAMATSIWSIVRMGSDMFFQHGRLLTPDTALVANVAASAYKKIVNCLTFALIKIPSS